MEINEKMILANLINGLDSYPLYDGINMISQFQGSFPSIIIPSLSSVHVFVKLSVVQDVRNVEIFDGGSAKDITIGGQKVNKCEWTDWMDCDCIAIETHIFEIKWQENKSNENETESDDDFIPCSQNVKAAPLSRRYRSMSSYLSPERPSQLQTSKSCIPQILAVSSQVVSQTQDTKIDDTPEVIEESDDEIIPETQVTHNSSSDEEEFVHVDQETQASYRDFMESQYIPLVEESYQKDVSHNDISSDISFGINNSTSMSMNLILEESNVSDNVSASKKDVLSHDNDDLTEKEKADLRDTSVTPDVDGMQPVDNLDLQQRERSLTPDLQEIEALEKTLIAEFTAENEIGTENNLTNKDSSKTDAEQSSNVEAQMSSNENNGTFLVPALSVQSVSKAPEIDDVFEMATQKFDFQKPGDDVFEAQTQIFEPSTSVVTQKQNEDIFNAKTRSFETSISVMNPSMGDNIFDAPTQPFKPSEFANKSSLHNQSLNESIFDASTQPFKLPTPVMHTNKPLQSLTNVSKKVPDNNIYDMPTQAFILEQYRLTPSPKPIAESMPSSGESDDDSSFLTAQTAVIPSQKGDLFVNESISQLSTPDNFAIKLPNPEQIENEVQNFAANRRESRRYFFEEVPDSPNPIASSTMIAKRAHSNAFVKPGTSRSSILTRMNVFSNIEFDTVSDLNTPEFLPSKSLADKHLTKLNDKQQQAKESNYCFEEVRPSDSSGSQILHKTNSATENKGINYLKPTTSSEKPVSSSNFSSIPQPKPPSQQRSFNAKTLPQPKLITHKKSTEIPKPLGSIEKALSSISSSGSKKESAPSPKKLDAAEQTDKKDAHDSRKRHASDSTEVNPAIRERSGRKKTKSTRLSDEFITEPLQPKKDLKRKQTAGKSKVIDVIDVSESSDEERPLKQAKRNRPIARVSPNISNQSKTSSSETEIPKNEKRLKIMTKQKSEEVILAKLVVVTSDCSKSTRPSSRIIQDECKPSTSEVTIPKTRSKLKSNLDDKKDKVDVKQKFKTKEKIDVAEKTKPIRKRNEEESKVTELDPSQNIRHSSRLKEKQKILFTRVNSDPYEKKIIKAGHTIVSCPSEATVLVSSNVYRTYKFLSALARGIPIVSEQWFTAWNGKNVPDPENYLLIDTEAEKRFAFSLVKCLTASQHDPLLKDYLVVASPSIKPPPYELKFIVESSQGHFTENVNQVNNKKYDKLLVVADKDDHKFLKTVKKLNPAATIINGEAFMLSIMRHKIVLERKYQL